MKMTIIRRVLLTEGDIFLTMPNPNRINEYMISPARNIVIKLHNHAVSDKFFVSQSLLVIRLPREVHPIAKHAAPAMARKRFCVEPNISISTSFFGNDSQLLRDEPYR